MRSEEVRKAAVGELWLVQEAHKFGSRPKVLMIERLDPDPKNPGAVWATESTKDDLITYWLRPHELLAKVATPEDFNVNQ